ncbi:MAG: phosphate signaling complex protein PhoU [Verrucomicrobia bacterium]|nr:phosphate signaling complex protein PhoU [Verrucomicrobiota bacterium]
MAVHLQKEIDLLKKSILHLCAVVEDVVNKAVTAVQSRDEDLARKVMSEDKQVDDEEVRVEEECLKALALHQPVAIDLRYIIACLKINNDLERIGDLAVNIAERAVYLSREPDPDIQFDFPLMAEKVQVMLRKSLDAFINMDAAIAHQVLESDDEIDAMNRDAILLVKEHIKSAPEHLDALINLWSVSRHLERIADHASNIAEDVIYMIEGKIVRHRAELI